MVVWRICCSGIKHMREYVLVVVFFFQAEDGIRDGTVTGVQTCALPILAASSWSDIGFCAVISSRSTTTNEVKLSAFSTLAPAASSASGMLKMSFLWKTL